MDREGRGGQTNSVHRNMGQAHLQTHEVVPGHDVYIHTTHQSINQSINQLKSMVAAAIHHKLSNTQHTHPPWASGGVVLELVRA
jgi:hypothetical protein